jgi:hypothetical protein
MDTDADKALIYRQRAEYTRVIAEGMPSPEKREAMLKFAQDYDHLADNVNERALHRHDSPASRV